MPCGLLFPVGTSEKRNGFALWSGGNVLFVEQRQELKRRYGGGQDIAGQRIEASVESMFVCERCPEQVSDDEFVDPVLWMK